MSGTAWVFPGQGSQEIGMGRDLYESFPAARELYDRADAILARPLSKLCFEGPAEELNRTENAQPAIYVTSLACLAAARADLAVEADPAFVAGHSLGEYSALAAASAMDFDAGLRLVETRGRLTQAAADQTPGGLAAVLGLDETTAQTICGEAGVELCNINSPGQIVIGGRKDALERAAALAIERGARRAVMLDVTGAFHTSLMQPAVPAMTEAVSSSGIREPRVPFVANSTAAPMTDAGQIGDQLVYQLTHPVRWVQCVETMTAAGVTTMIEFGPGRVLTGLIKRIATDVTLRNINGAGSLRS